MKETYETDGESSVDITALNEKYREKGYFRRLKDMFAGLGAPHGSAEYKLARIELQRQSAPLVSVTAVLLLVTVIAVMTMMPKDRGEEYSVTIAEANEEPKDIEDPVEEPPPADPEPQPDIEVDIATEISSPAPFIEQLPVPEPAAKVSVKPAPQDAALYVDSPVKMPSMASSRTPGSIGGLTIGGAGIGDPATEIAVMKVLWWLKAHQNTDGSWSGGNKLANTALAVLTYLAHGEHPGSKSPFRKDFGPVVQLAVDYIVNSVDQSGATVKMRGADGNEYAFLIATYALCETYGMTRNPNCKDAAYVCLDRIVRGQSPTGGWDYKINPKSDRDDMSFAGWALQALKAGKMAGLHPEGLDECIKKAVRCLQTRNFKNGGFNYVANGNPTGLTATGCLAMQLLGYGNKKEVADALEFMREWEPSFEGRGAAKAGGPLPGTCPQYYCYYATQCKYQAGMKPGAKKSDEAAWFKWNAAMKKLYPAKIIDLPEKVKDWSGQEHRQGYYQNTDAHTSRPVMDTCLAALQLMVYYRYLPTSQVAKAADEPRPGANVAASRDDDVNIVVDF